MKYKRTELTKQSQNNKETDITNNHNQYSSFTIWTRQQFPFPLLKIEYEFLQFNHRNVKMSPQNQRFQRSVIEQLPH